MSSFANPMIRVGWRRSAINLNRQSVRWLPKVRKDFAGDGLFVKRHSGPKPSLALTIKATPKPALFVAKPATTINTAKVATPETELTPPKAEDQLPPPKLEDELPPPKLEDELPAPKAQDFLPPATGKASPTATTQSAKASPSTPPPPPPPNSGNSSGSKGSSGKRHPYLKWGLIIGGTGVVLFLTSDLARHIFICYERCAVVAVAVARNFKLYKDCLGAEYPNDEAYREALSKTHKKAAEITYKAIERNGGIYIKLGQHISALTYLLPPEWCETMIPLQDRCPRSLMEEIENMFKHDMGVLINEMFSEFDPNPVGVALLAQVHVARLRLTGEMVAVKVQHPLLSEFVPLDVYVTNIVFRAMERFFPEYPLLWLGDEMQQLIYNELDFTKEALNAENTAEDFKGRARITALRIPKIVLAEKRILVMEYVAGARLDDYAYLQQHNIDPAQVSLCLLHIFNTMIFVPGIGLHCDPHGGNLSIRHVPAKESTTGFNFEIVLYDHGLYRTLPLVMKREYSHFWLAVLDNDIPAMRYWAEEFAGITEDIKFQIFAAAITGRAPEVALNFDMSKLRLEDEISHIQLRLNHEEGILEGLMEILSTMPRLVLLILKTNDLTRHLDEGLRNPLGPVRTFLILAKYCAKTVYDEAMDGLRDQYSLWLVVGNLKRLGTWWAYQTRCSQLYIYDLLLWVKNAFKGTH